MLWFLTDYWYIVLVLPAVIFSVWANVHVNSTFERYAKKLSLRGMTGAEAAKRVLESNGVHGVDIQRTGGHLTDHYDPRKKTIFLSDSVYASTSCAAIGVAAHESGHAVQYATNYGPIKFRMGLVSITNFSSMLAIPLFFIGLLFSAEPLMLAGILMYSAIAFFQLVTLPVEFNASSRALRALSGSGMLSQDELGASKKVLTAAALTYVAAAATSLAQLLRLLAIYGRRRRN